MVVWGVPSLFGVSEQEGNPERAVGISGLRQSQQRDPGGNLPAEKGTVASVMEVVVCPMEPAARKDGKPPSCSITDQISSLEMFV